MAIQWQWKEKVGTAEIFNRDKVYTYQLYRGNAFLIFLYEYEEDGKEMYNMHSFFVDERHAKRMLGIDKQDKATYGDNCFATTNYRLEKIRINKKIYGESYTKKLVDMLIKAFDKIEIEIYSEDIKED